MSAKFVISKALKEVRFHLSQSGEASAPLHKFLASNYETLKAATSHKIPVLIREASGLSPSVTARFEQGKEIKNNLEGLDSKGVEEAVKSLLK